MLADRRPWAAGLLVALALGACGSGSGSEETAQEPSGPYATTVTALCAARDAAGDGDLDIARDHFFRDAHEPLHELATEVGEVDRTVAASVLQTKQAVESALDDPPPAEVIRERLAALTTAVRDAVTELGDDPPSC